MEHMMAYSMRRLGGDERHIVEWYRAKNAAGSAYSLHGAVNALLNSLKPPRQE
jgi:hypothetical protein